ncbi:MAG: hypothetical protein AAF585_29870 [Verrucomicrobiota bacterium]
MRRTITSIIILLSAAAVTIGAEFKPKTKSQPQRQGKIYHGIMFKHLDLDGDGKIEEWRRGEWRHMDTNRDGIPDVFRKLKADGGYQQGWDSDKDGVYDMAQDFTADGKEADFSFEYPIEITSPAQAIKRDRIVRIQTVIAR